MNAIDTYFSSLTDRVLFLELREDRAIGHEDLAHLPLPVYADEILSDVTAGRLDEEIDLSAFLRGMVYLLAIDPAFVHTDRYREILDRYLKAPDAFAMSLGASALDEIRSLQQESSDPEGKKVKRSAEKALLAFRAARFLNPDNLDAAEQYARLLWSVPETSERDAFMDEAVRILERVLRADAKRASAHTFLGEIYENRGEYLKADASYRHAIAVCAEEPILEELRRARERIAPDVGVMNAIYFLRRADYRRAIEELTAVKAVSTRYDVDYYLGVAYENIASYDAACDALLSALKKGADFEALYGDLVFCLNAAGRVQEALRYADEGLETNPRDVRLRYNRAVLRTDTGDVEGAVEDCDFILEYADLSDEMFNRVMILREHLTGEKTE